MKSLKKLLLISLISHSAYGQEPDNICFTRSEAIKLYQCVSVMSQDEKIKESIKEQTKLTEPSFFDQTQVKIGVLLLVGLVGYEVGKNQR